MELTSEEKSRAMRISRALELFFDQNPGTADLRSTDAYDVLVTKNLVERDKSRGFFFREFLKKLHRAVRWVLFRSADWRVRSGISPGGEAGFGFGELAASVSTAFASGR